MRNTTLLQFETSAIKEINEYCNLVKQKTGVMKKRILTSLILEAIRRDLAKVKGAVSK